MEPKRKELGEDAKAKAKAKAKAERKSDGPAGAKEEPAAFGAREELKESPPAHEEVISGNDEAEANAEDEHPDEGTAGGRVRPRFGRVVWFGAAGLCLLLIAAGFFFMQYKGHIGLFANASPRLEPVTSIMRPIPVPDYREMLDFLVVSEIDGQRMITAIRMEIGFQNPTRYQNFKDRNVAFRDTVYSFLLQQNLSRNTLKSWHSILEKDLLDCLKAKLSQSYADTIRLVQVENL